MSPMAVRMIRAGMRALLTDPGVRGALAQRADRVVDRARETAPVASGQYRDSIRRASAETDRAVERVEALAPHALVVESRTGNLARALGDVGL